MAKLTAAQVAEIRERYAKKEATQTVLAMEYGVRHPTINRIVNDKNWVP